jgi:putative ABC transport system permease protein
MRHVFYLVRRYLRANPAKTFILVGSLTLLIYLPAGMQILVSRSSAELRGRAESTPLLIGAKGSSLDLALRALYFQGEVPAPLAYSEAARVAKSGLAAPIPLHARFHVAKFPVVGTTLDYFEFRKLRLAQGVPFGLLGECLLGADAAAALDVGPGDTVVTSPENIFDLAGSYPLRMRVAGVFAPAHGPDDRAVFVDLKTTWVLEGLGHGHNELRKEELLPSKDGERTANASVQTFQEITAQNIDSFHFHGDLGGYPITALLAVPRDERSRTLLLGRYLAANDPARILEPREVMEDLIATVVRVRGYVMAVTALLGAATLATVSFLFLLSLRLRRREMATMHRIGCSRGMVASLIASEAAIVLALAAVLASILVLVTVYGGESLIRAVFV